LAKEIEFYNYDAANLGFMTVRLQTLDWQQISLLTCVPALGSLAQ